MSPDITVVESLGALNVVAYSPEAQMPDEFRIEIPFHRTIDMGYAAYMEFQRNMELACRKLIERGYDIAVWDDPQFNVGRMLARKRKPARKPQIDGAIDV